MPLYAVLRSNGKWFMRPAQFEQFGWSPDRSDAWLCGSREEAERIRLNYPEFPDAKVVEIKR